MGYCASLCHQLHWINHWRSLDLCGHRKSCLPRFSFDCHGQQCGTRRTSKDCRRQGSKGFLFLGFRAFGMLSCIVSSIEKGAIGNFVWRLLVHGCIIHWWYSVHRSPIFVVQACETPSKCFLCEKSKLKIFIIPFSQLFVYICFLLFQVRTWKMHAFTIVQLVGLGILWAVKDSPIALAFPFFVVLMVPLRMILKFFFTPEELEAVSLFIFCQKVS